jgi:hypothetical protein
VSAILIFLIETTTRLISRELLVKARKTFRIDLNKPLVDEIQARISASKSFFKSFDMKRSTSPGGLVQYFMIIKKYNGGVIKATSISETKVKCRAVCAENLLILMYQELNTQ